MARRDPRNKLTRLDEKATIDLTKVLHDSQANLVYKTKELKEQ